MTSCAGLFPLFWPLPLAEELLDDDAGGVDAAEDMAGEDGDGDGAVDEDEVGARGEPSCMGRAAAPECVGDDGVT